METRRGMRSRIITGLCRALVSHAYLPSFSIKIIGININSSEGRGGAAVCVCVCKRVGVGAMC